MANPITASSGPITFPLKGRDIQELHKLLDLYIYYQGEEDPAPHEVVFVDMVYLLKEFGIKCRHDHKVIEVTADASILQFDDSDVIQIARALRGCFKVFGEPKEGGWVSICDNRSHVIFLWTIDDGKWRISEFWLSDLLDQMRDRADQHGQHAIPVDILKIANQIHWPRAENE